MTDFVAASYQQLQNGDQLNAYRLLIAAAEREPGNPQIWYRLGVLLQDPFKQYHSAVAAFSRSNRLQPGDHKTLTNLGINLGLVCRLAEAESALRQAVLAEPKGVLAHVHLSQTLYARGKLDHALREAQSAIEADGTSCIAHLAAAFVLCALGRWREGFAEFEYRYQYKLPEFLTYPYPLWKGEHVGALLIIGEQGIGDAIQMMRYVSEAARLVDRVKWYVHGEMRRLAPEFAGRLDGAAIEVVPMPSPLPEVDAFCPIMSLPLALGIEQPVFDGPYIEASQIGRRATDDRLRIGIAWAGSPAHSNTQHRDVPLEEFLPLAEIPGVELFSLQVGADQQDLDRLCAHAIVRDLAPQISDLSDTARLIAGLDLVICCDTAVGHLAGAMGKEVWLLVNELARDWRWGRHGKRTPWYPGHLIMSREIGEGWGDLMGRVAEALRERMKQ